MKDEFEARHMRDEGRVVHRDKRVSRWQFALMASIGVLVMVFAGYLAAINGASPKPLPAVALPFVVAALASLGLMFVGIGLVFSVVRTIVTERHVHVKYGLWGPRIPLASIRSCKVVAYNWTAFGGWGIRQGQEGTWAYVPGGNRAIELCYREGDEEKRVLVGADDCDETALQINRARQARDAGGRARIEELPPTHQREEEEEELSAEPESDRAASMKER